MNRLVACNGIRRIARISRSRRRPRGRMEQADRHDRERTVQVPNKVLPPGKYVMKLLDSPSDRHIVQIFNADETHLFTTILAIPNYRMQPTGKTVSRSGKRLPDNRRP